MRGRFLLRTALSLTVVSVGAIASAATITPVSPFVGTLNDNFSSYAMTGLNDSFRHDFGDTGIMGGNAHIKGSVSAPSVRIFGDPLKSGISLTNLFTLGDVAQKAYKVDGQTYHYSRPRGGVNDHALGVVSLQPYDVVGGDADAPLSISFSDNNVTRFGAYWNAYTPAPLSSSHMSITFYKGATNLGDVDFGDSLNGPDLHELAADKWQFFGWQVDTAFDRIEIRGYQYVIDDITAGQDAVPEPASLIALGLGAAAVIRRRRR